MSRRLSYLTTQVVRRVLQTGVFAFMAYAALGAMFRNYKIAHNSARIVGLIHGEGWRKAYEANEALLELWGEPFRASLDFSGMPWASRVFGVTVVDPILFASSILDHGVPKSSLALAALGPVVLAVVLGKVFCSHLCPMRLIFEIGQWARSGLLRLGVDLPRFKLAPRWGGWVLFGGLLASYWVGALVWYLLLPYVSVGSAVFLGISVGAGLGLLVVPVMLLTIDSLLAPGVFCHNICPQGFLLEQLGRWSRLRVEVRTDIPCPDKCRTCEQICPYGLSPRTKTHRPSCDNCGTCVGICPKHKLARKFVLPVIAAVALLMHTTAAQAHHNKGLPHYGYFENYPQVPTEENVVVQGHWEFGATIFNFQGYDRRTADTPNDIKFFTYVYDLTTGRNYTKAVDFEVELDGEIVGSFTRQGVDEEMVYSSRETLPETGDYELVARFPSGDKTVTLRLPFHVDLGSTPVNWTLLTLLGAPALLVFGLALLGRTRRARARGLKDASSAAAALAILAYVGRAHAAEAIPECRPGSGTELTYAASDGRLVSVMHGIPPWLLLVGVVLVIVTTFVVVELLAPGSPSSARFNLIKQRRLYRVFRSRWLQPVFQLTTLALLIGIVYSGLFGSSSYNLAPVLVWTLWWGGLIFAVLFLGPAFCFACPWDALANLISRLSLKSRVDSLSLGLPVPRWLKSMWPAILLFAFLSWAELGLGVTTDPRKTAYLGLGMALLAVLGALLFHGKAFCRYACPVGRIQGVYSNFSPVELRARNPRTCQKCETEDCLHGNERGYPCPTGISLKVVQDSTYCIGCTECIKSCNKYNVALNVRPPAVGLGSTWKPRPDEAWMCLILLSLTLFHGLTMTTAWESHAPGSTSVLKWLHLTLGGPKWLSFTLAMLLACGVPLGLYWISCRVAARWVNGAVNTRTLFFSYASALLPVALFYHLAHNGMHLAMEGGHVVPLLSDPLGRGADYFGTANLRIGHLIPELPLSAMQVLLIAVGHVFGVIVAHRVSRHLFDDKKRAIKSLIPMTCVMVFVSVAGLSLMVLDMNMRAGRM